MLSTFLIKMWMVHSSSIKKSMEGVLKMLAWSYWIKQNIKIPANLFTKVTNSGSET